MPLTDREQELLDLLALDYTQADAAEMMGLSRQRVQQLWKRLLDKGAVSVRINPKKGLSARRQSDS